MSRALKEQPGELHTAPTPASILRGVARGRTQPGGAGFAARRFARRLLEAGEPRLDVVTALCSSFGYSEDKARRVVARAIKRGGGE